MSYLANPGLKDILIINGAHMRLHNEWAPIALCRL